MEPISSDRNPDPAQEIRSLAAGVRAIALVFALILSYFNARLAFQIGNFDAIFSDMLGGKPLPLITNLILQGRTIFIILALLIPLASVLVVVRIRSHKLALYSLAALMLGVFVQILLTWTGLFAPLMSIISGMRGAG